MEDLNMDSKVQCPVCTLFLHSGITLESHLDTHPKDQVIKALCSLSTKRSNFESQILTPSQLECSFQSRSSTPLEDDRMQWLGGHRNLESDRYWRRTPSSTKSTPIPSGSRIVTPDIRTGDINFQSSATIPGEQFSENSSYSIKTDKTQKTSSLNDNISDFDQQYPYYQEQGDDREIKYSRCSEYNPMDSSSSIFSQNMLQVGSVSSLKPPSSISTTLLPLKNKDLKLTTKQDLVQLHPNSNNIVVNNSNGVQYVAPGVKVVMPATPTFVQKKVQSNTLLSGNLPTVQTHDRKGVTQPLSNNQYNPTSGTFSPGTTVVTQSSQINYREIMHNVDAETIASSMQTTLGGPDNVNSVTPSSSMYENVMVADQFGNTPCMYTSQQQIVRKSCNTSFYSDNQTKLPNKSDTGPGNKNDGNKSLIIEVGPFATPPLRAGDVISNVSLSLSSDIDEDMNKKDIEKTEWKSEPSGSSKGLIILSNIKVETPVQHKESMLNMVIDLTGTNNQEYPELITSEKKPPKSSLGDNNENFSDDCAQLSLASSDILVSNAFSVIKNVGNPPPYKDSSSKCSIVGSKIETDFSDSCPVPDLICNEKPSISPCSELFDHGDNSTDIVPLFPKPESSRCSPSITSEKNVPNNKFSPKQCKLKTFRLNNIYVKKHKKKLQIKNAKVLPTQDSDKMEIEPIPSSSICKTPENFSINKIYQTDNTENKTATLHTVPIDKLRDNEHNEFDADTEEQPMDIEPVVPSRLNDSNNFCNNIGVNNIEVKVKEEVNTSNESSFSIQGQSLLNTSSIEGLRPINVISYGAIVPGDFEDESNHRELLDLEAASKNKQFVNMMNDNYFSENIYADYFNPDRVESFGSDKVSNLREPSKDNMYIWGEPSHKESEFVLPNFIHESYKMIENNGPDYTSMDRDNMSVGNDKCDQDSKLNMLSECRSEGETPLNICTDERMPPRGELSGQESNGNTESSWTGMCNDVASTEPYDLMARESWVSDSSDVDANEKRDKIEDEVHLPKTRMYKCIQCRTKYPSLKELRSHKALFHSLPTSSNAKPTYSRLVNSRTIKKEEKPDENDLEKYSGNLLVLNSKGSIETRMKEVYDAMSVSKPAIDSFIKPIPKRKKKDFVCPTCKVDQLTDVGFNDHLKIHPLECLTCGKCFFKRANLSLHIKSHLGIKNFKCDVCEKRFATRQKMSEHRNVHTGHMPVKCTMCDETFRRHSNMVQHRDRYHYNKKRKVQDFVCQCGAVYHSKAKFLWHKETHEPKPKSCLYCSDKFVHSSSLTRHVRRAHNESYLSENVKYKVENVPCPVCKQLYLRTNLQAHVLTHSGKKPFTCVVCNKSFTTKWNLKLHRWTHMNRSAKPFKCKLCNGAFIRHSDYVSHMNSHKSVRPYTCNYCGCQFIRKYNCQRHVKEHENAKKFVCKVPECGKSFHRSYYLSEHMKVHSGVRPFACNICGRTSSNKSNHNKHMKIHHSREPIATEA